MRTHIEWVVDIDFGTAGFSGYRVLSYVPGVGYLVDALVPSEEYVKFKEAYSRFAGFQANCVFRPLNSGKEPHDPFSLLITTIPEDVHPVAMARDESGADMTTFRLFLREAETGTGETRIAREAERRDRAADALTHAILGKHAYIDEETEVDEVPDVAGRPTGPGDV